MAAKDELLRNCDCEYAISLTDYAFAGLAGTHTGCPRVVGKNSVAFGYSSLGEIKDGNSNVAVGHCSLKALTSGAHNIGLGAGAGSVFINESLNIDLAHPGVPGDAGRIRLGIRGVHTAIDLPQLVERPPPVTPPAGNCTVSISDVMTGILHKKVPAGRIARWTLDAAAAMAGGIAGVRPNDRVSFVAINADEPACNGEDEGGHEGVARNPEGEELEGEGEDEDGDGREGGAGRIVMAAGQGGKTVGDMTVATSGRFVLRFAAGEHRDGGLRYVLYRA